MSLYQYVYQKTTGPCCLANRASHRHSELLWVLCRLLSLTILDIVVRRMSPGVPPILIDGPSGSSATHHLDTFRAPYHDVHRVTASTPPISIDGRQDPSGSSTTHHLDTSNALHVVGSCDKRTLYVPYLQLLLTVRAGHVTIDILPDDVLLLIFLFDRATSLSQDDKLWWRWDRLVHVCRRWRSVIFASPNFLGLKLACGPWTRVELWPPLPIMLINWPPLPIILMNRVMPEGHDFDAAIVHHDRICEIDLHSLTASQLRRLASAMKKQFPALVRLKLDLGHYKHPAPALPDGFLGGSAPRLQSLELHSISFPALPTLLLSATNLVSITLWRVPHSGYFSPEAIALSLAVLTNLKSLIIEFESSRSRPNRDSRPPPPKTRPVLPALIRFEFHGVNTYLEGLLARIDAPLLVLIQITFSYKPIFDTPQLAYFMRRTARFQAVSELHVNFDDYGVRIESLPHARTFDKESMLRISSRELDRQLLSLTQVITSFVPSICMVENLYIYGSRYLPSRGQDRIENQQWLDVFRPFTAVKNLYVTKKFVKCVVPPLKELVGERALEVLPALECLLLEELQPSGPVPEAIRQFLDARQQIAHPVAVSCWNRTRQRVISSI